MTQHWVHDHGFDPGCRETEGPDGLLRGDCVRRFYIIEYVGESTEFSQAVDSYSVKGTRMRDQIVSEISADGNSYVIKEKY